MQQWLAYSSPLRMQLLDHIFACMLVAEARAIIQSSVLANT